MSDPQPLPEQNSATAPDATEYARTHELQPDEFYFEGPYMVFTEAYHQRRGFCCNSDCRHCPYR